MKQDCSLWFEGFLNHKHRAQPPPPKWGAHFYSTWVVLMRYVGRTGGVGGRLGMLVGLSGVGVGLNSWGECGRDWEQRSSSVSLCGSPALLPCVFLPSPEDECPHSVISIPSLQLPPELSLSAAVFVAFLLNPNELPSRRGEIAVLRGFVCKYASASDLAPAPKEKRTARKVVGWLFLCSVHTFQCLLSVCCERKKFSLHL